MLALLALSFSHTADILIGDFVCAQKGRQLKITLESDGSASSNIPGHEEGSWVARAGTLQFEDYAVDAEINGFVEPGLTLARDESGLTLRQARSSKRFAPVGRPKFIHVPIGEFRLRGREEPRSLTIRADGQFEERSRETYRGRWEVRGGGFTTFGMSIEEVGRLGTRYYWRTRFRYDFRTDRLIEQTGRIYERVE